MPPDEQRCKPTMVRLVVTGFFLWFRERNIPEVESMYEVSFPKLSERYFKASSWPQVDAISDLVDQDHVFCLLYKVGRAIVSLAICRPIAYTALVFVDIIVTPVADRVSDV